MAQPDSLRGTDLLDFLKEYNNSVSHEPIPGICRACGCTDEDPCFYVDPLDSQPRACSWIQADLCSRCAEACPDEPLIQVIS